MIVCVTGGKGGPGATVLAANLALAWSRTQRSCLLVDLDPFGGDVGAYLDPALLDPRKGLLPLLKLERNGVSPEAVKREVQQVTPGLNVLLGSLRPACDLLSGRVSEVLRSAHRIADVVVADLTGRDHRDDGQAGAGGEPEDQNGQQDGRKGAGDGAGFRRRHGL